MCDIPDIYRSVCRSVLWWCWAMINVLYWLETVETSPSLPVSQAPACCVLSEHCAWTGWPSHTFSPPGSRKRETSESILPNILFVPYPTLVCASLGSECGHTGHRRTHGARCTADSVGWCGMVCVCIARCCTVWRMSGQEMTFCCMMSPLTTNTAGSSAAATWGQLLRRRCSCWWSPDSSEDHRDLSGTEHLLKMGFILR